MDFCRNCGYILTPADTTCPDCGTPVGGGARGPTFSSIGSLPKKPDKKPGETKKGDRGAATKPPPIKGKSQGPVTKPPPGEIKEEEPVIIKPWAPQTEKEKKSVVEDDLSSSFIIKTVDIKKKMTIGQSNFLRENLKYLLIAVAVIFVVYAILYPRFREERIQQEVEEKEYTAMIEDGKESNNPKLLLKRADHYFDTGQPKEALADLEKVTKILPSDSVAYAKIAGYYFKVKKDYKKSIEKYTLAIKYKRDEPEYYMRRAIAYEAIYNYPAAIKDFGDFIKLEPMRAEGYAGRAKVYRKMKIFDKSVKDMEKAVEFGPESKDHRKDLAKGYFMMAESMREKGREKAAIEYLKKTIEYNKNHGKAQDELSNLNYSRGLRFLQQKNRKKAMEAFTEAINIQRRNVQALIKRAEIYDILHDRDNAIRDFQTAMDIDKRQTQLEAPLMRLYGNRAAKFEREGNKGKAVEDYSQMLRLKPNNTAVIFKRAKLNYERGDYSASSREFTLFLRLSPGNKEAIVKLVESHNELGMNRIVQKNFKDAKKQFETALKWDSGSIKAKVGMAEVMTGNRDFNNAMNAINGILKSKPGNPDALRARANAYLGKGETKKAMADIDRAISARPNDALLRLIRGNIYESMNNRGKAKENWKKARDLAIPKSFIQREAYRRL